MVFHSNAALALLLIALGIGYWVLMTSRRGEVGSLKGFGNILGYFIIISAFILFLIVSYYSVRYWEDGHDSIRYHPGETMGRMSMHGGGHETMMAGMHSDCLMMKQGGAEHRPCMANEKGGMESCDMHADSDNDKDGMRQDHKMMEEDQEQE